MNRRQSGMAMALWLCGAVLLFAVRGAAAPGRPSGQAIQFGMGSNLTLSTFGEATLAYQHFIRRDLACRTTVGVNLKYDGAEHSVERGGPNAVDDSRDQMNWDNSVSIVSELLWYRGTTVAVFFGCGPRVLYSNSRWEAWDYYPPDRSWVRDRERVRQAGGGLQGCLGVQWAATAWLALHAEYDARAMYLHVVAETESPYYEDHEPLKETITTNRLSFQSPGVRFGLSVYF